MEIRGSKEEKHSHMLDRIYYTLLLQMIYYHIISYYLLYLFLVGEGGGLRSELNNKLKTTLINIKPNLLWAAALFLVRMCQCQQEA